MSDPTANTGPEDRDGEDARWFWCLRHQRPERAGECRAEDRLGPYESEDAARSWKERVDRRNDRWEEDDDRWHGRDR